MSFAEDLLYVAQTKLTWQHLLDKATPLFRERGPEITGEKSWFPSLGTRKLFLAREHSFE